MADHAFVQAVHAEPPSELASQIDVVVRYGEREAQLSIRPKQPMAAHHLRREAVAEELRELAAALLRIADRPLEIDDGSPRRPGGL